MNLFNLIAMSGYNDNTSSSLSSSGAPHPTPTAGAPPFGPPHGLRAHRTPFAILLISSGIIFFSKKRKKKVEFSKK